ncbi:MAG: tRNA dihydrouridine(20/20a) synthase DusA [Proteobacteria bacterium]|nr:MAG: tRNA dihydrouridine(20/20a) synthase DusA [Pseudomonadota bacterium]
MATLDSSTRGVVRPLSVAPMMARTDRHFRVFMRQLSREVLLYTEMVTTGAIIHGDRDQLLGYSEIEHPIALQLGGNDPKALAECARIAEGWGYDEVNLNVGCPSDRVQSGDFGACLMAHPERVAESVAAMREAVAIPVTVKHRIGIDHIDRYEDMRRFVDRVAAAGSDRFTVHARKAWLQGLSPKDNRTIPPLRYEDVHRLKRERPQLVIEINGGIRSLDTTLAQLRHVDAVMIGRAAFEDPYALADADRRVFGVDRDAPSRHDVVRGMLPYVAEWTARGERVHRISRHLLTLFAGRPGSRAWKRHLSENPRAEDGVALLKAALAKVPERR